MISLLINIMIFRLDGVGAGKYMIFKSHGALFIYGAGDRHAAMPNRESNALCSRHRLFTDIFLIGRNAVISISCRRYDRFKKASISFILSAF